MFFDKDNKVQLKLLSLSLLSMLLSRTLLGSRTLRLNEAGLPYVLAVGSQVKEKLTEEGSEHQKEMNATVRNKKTILHWDRASERESEADYGPSPGPLCAFAHL